MMNGPMARIGAEMWGADEVEENIAVAGAHPGRMALEIDCRATTAEALAAAGEEFDVILNMEVIEHVSDPQLFLDTCARMLKPGGIMLTSTINRTAKAWAMAIIAAERLLRWLPPGTHEWQKFITKDELFAMLEEAGLEPVDARGFVFDPVNWGWRISPSDLDVNYVTAANRPG